MGDPITIGTIVISALPAVLPGLVSLVQAWASRSINKKQTYKIRTKAGDQIVEYSGDPEELNELIKKLTNASQTSKLSQTSKSSRASKSSKASKSSRLLKSKKGGKHG